MAPPERLRAYLAGLVDRPAREAWVVWGLVIVSIGLAKSTIGLVPFGGSIVGALAVALFLWAPGEANRFFGRDDDDYGMSLRTWKRDFGFALAVMVVVFPLFAWGFRGFVWLLEHKLPGEWARHLVPYGASSRFTWRLPTQGPQPFVDTIAGFLKSAFSVELAAATRESLRAGLTLLDKVAGNIAVALGEEFFYRGYVMDRLQRAYPPRARLLGAPFGKAAVIQTVMFAAGHLLNPQAFRLGTFFPGLLFSWMALRSGGVVAGAIVHAGSNLLIATLEASAFGR